MKGYVNKIIENSYGFIYDDNDVSYFFHKKDLINCNIFQLAEGDVVEFEVGVGTNGKPAASQVRKKYQSTEEQKVAHPGMNPSVLLNGFNDDEKTIISFFEKFFYVTSAGEVEVGQSAYRYFLIKPTDFYSKTFMLTREIVVVFSDYVSFEPRSLDASSFIYNRIESKLRLDRGFQLFISHDDEIEAKLKTLFTDRGANQIVIPFTYRELLDSSSGEELIKNRFRQYLFDTDLFSVTTPIQNDVFFFGRRDYVYDIVSKCKNHTNSGVFGLRRSGKTSLLYAVQNLLHQQSYPTVFIPCESDLSELDWKRALCKVVKDVYQAMGLDMNNILESEYQTPSATVLFEQQMYNCLRQIKVPLTIMFDEIEAITFSVSRGENSNNLWLDGDNFVRFWNAIKGYYSKHPSQLSILVAGTNPMINEVSSIGKSNLQNPMFNQLSESNQGAYLPPFTTEDTRNMVNTLGGYMGLSFDDYCVSSLTEDCGGHPYLMRILCSQINKHTRNVSLPRPLIVSKKIYQESLSEFKNSLDSENFFLMVLNILMASYPKEFNALKYLALGNSSMIAETQDKESLHHLIGYGLVAQTDGKYTLKFQAISDFLKGKYRFERQGLSIDEQKEEISARVNQVEIQLRVVIKTALIAKFGTATAKERVLKAMESSSNIHPGDLVKARGMTLNELFDSSVNKIYFSLLENIIEQNYGAFSNIFESVSEPQLETRLEAINKARRCPSHSYSESSENWSWTNFEEFRENITWFERMLSKFE